MLAWNCLILLSLFAPLFSDNQTTDISPIHSEKYLPFRLQVDLADFSLPNGLQSFDSAVYDGHWLLLAGRTNGLHDFGNNQNAFPPKLQNKTVYVVDPHSKKIYSRSLTDPESGLTQQQIDSLSVSNAQSYQTGDTLYLTGGYGVDSSTGIPGTKSSLTAINIPGMMRWVTKFYHHDKAAEHIRQISDPLFQVTGGYMLQVDKQPTLLVFGQNFAGYYYNHSNGVYSQQVRRFKIYNDCHGLRIVKYDSIPSKPDPNFRRRDLNVVPLMRKKNGTLKPLFVALAGVFTPTGGAWNVPVEISANGTPKMKDPKSPHTFKQGMNNYIGPTVGLYSEKTGDMYTIVLGGISYAYAENGEIKTDYELPFINNISTIKIDKKNRYKQYLMSAEYPTILSTHSNPGNKLLFGAGAEFFPADGLPSYSNGVIKFDELKDDLTLLGYVVGGIQSTLPNTSLVTDTAASPYIFSVIFKKY